MGENRNCFSLLKSKLCCLGADFKPQDEKEEFYVGSKSRHPNSSVDRRLRPPGSPLPGKSLSEAEEAQSKHAVAVAIATAAAAEAAVAAAQAAAQVVRLTGTGGSYHQLELARRISAAIRIQSAFRGCLARKALCALKGVVELQALIRGHIVRRQTKNAFRSMQALQRIQSQTCSRRLKMTEEDKIQELKLKRHRQIHIVREIDGNQRKWDSSIRSKEQTDIMFLSRQEAAFKRERAKEYYLDQPDKRILQKSTASTSLKQSHINAGTVEWSWIEHWMDAQTHRRGSESSSASSFDKNPIIAEKHISEAKTCLDSLYREEEVQSKLNGRVLQHKRGTMRSQSPTSKARKPSQKIIVRDDESYASSTASLPSYMVYTESAKAKSRSSSTPRQRMGTSRDSSDQKSLNKNTSFASLRSDASSTHVKRGPNCQLQSPALRGLPGPVKSDRALSFNKDRSLDSDGSFLNLDHQRVLR